MPPLRYDPFDPGIFLDFAGAEDFQRYLIGNWKMKLWWSGSRWVEDRSKSRLFSDFTQARDEAWHIRINCLRFPEQ